jgi:galactonate dehydratase
MKITGVEILTCLAGWRSWYFLKVSTDSGFVGFSDCTESFGSQKGINAAIEELSQHILGMDPLATDLIHWELYRRTRQSCGGIIQKALGGIENALLDIKGKALGVPVYKLLGGPFRDKVKVYWSHCGTTRIRSSKFINDKKIESLDDIVALGKEVKSQGFQALKTNILLPGSPFSVLMQGFKGEFGSSSQDISPQILRGIESSIAAFRQGAGDDVDIMLDLNFNFRKAGYERVAKVLEPYNLAWLELDTMDPNSLVSMRRNMNLPIASCENLFGLRQYKPFFENHAAEIVIIDLLWNGVAQSKKIADMAESYDINVAPHNHYSPLATVMAGHFAYSVPNIKIVELDVDEIDWADDLVTDPAIISNGLLTINDKPGWGTDLNCDLLKPVLNVQ